MKKKENSEYEKLYSKWKHAKNKTDANSKDEAKKLEKMLADKYSDSIYSKIKDEIEGINCEDGGRNSGHLWRLKNKLITKQTDPPTAMVDEKGNMVTGTEAIRELTLNHYKKVLENRPIKEHLKEYQIEREDLALKRMAIASKVKTPPLFSSPSFWVEVPFKVKIHV